MLQNRPPLTTLVLLLGFVFFGIVLGLQWWLHDLRLLIDGSVSTFIIAADGWFDVAEQRHLIGLNQLFPVIAANLGASIKTIANSYLLNDMIIYPISFLLLLFPLRNPKYALVLMLGYAAVAKYHFFIITYSLLIGWPLVVLFYAFYQHHGFNIPFFSLRMLLLLIIGYFIVYAHPVLAVTFFFWGVYHYFKADNGQQKRKMLYPAAFVGLLLIVKWLMADPYDMHMASSIDPTAYLNLDPYILKMHLLTPRYYPIYALAVPAGLFLSIRGIFRGEWKAHAATIVAIAYLVLVYILYGIYGKWMFGPWMPNAIAAPSFLLVLVVTDYLWPKLLAFNKAKQWVVGIVITLLFCWEFSVVLQHVKSTFEQRFELIASINSQVPNEGWSKYMFIVDKQNEDILYSLITPSELSIWSCLHSIRATTPNIVIVDDVEAKELENFYKDLIYMHENRWFPVNECSPPFNFKEGPFKKVYLK